MRWRSRERKCKIETHVNAGQEIAKREGVELWRTLALGWGFGRRWAGACVCVERHGQQRVDEGEKKMRRKEEERREAEERVKKKERENIFLIEKEREIQ